MKPILFNTEMVRAILDGRKTTTRRVIKPQPEEFGKAFAFKNGIYATLKAAVREAPYQPGDALYVRETFVKADDGYHYRADATPGSEQLRKDYGYKYRPSIHMPKEAARIFLRVTDVRAERLQDIECIATEGVTMVPADDKRDPRYYFAKLWDSTVKPAGLPLYGWAANPWVWVIEFERTVKPDA